MQNPLIELAERGDLPAFDKILPEHAEPAIDALLARNRAEVGACLENAADPSWETLVEPLEEAGDRLTRAWSAVGHLWGVTNTESWRKAYSTCLPKLTEYGLELAQSEPLFRAYERLSQREDFADEPMARRKAVSDALREFRLSGVALPAEQKQRYKALSMRLSELQTKFEEHLVDATQAWTLHIEDESRLKGMTESGKAQAAQRARAKDLTGWLLTLDFPSYDAVITYADDRELRAQLYEAFATRASDQGPFAGRFDNTPLLGEILDARYEQARLLGLASFAELSLATKMAESPADVERFLLELAGRARRRAQAELDELRAFARDLGGPADLQPWDVGYYAEKLKEKKLGLSDDELRPYFPAPQVIAGMLALAGRLYDVSFETLDGVPTWHKDVTVYALKNAQGRRFASFYLDPYAREQKRGGAWMDECRIRRHTARGLQDPVAFLTCNFAPPLPGQPALLTHDEVLTLFHEFGHGLQHLLTRVDVAAVSGIRGVEWDAVELPSQFMENWCYTRETLQDFARHWQTGAKLPDELLARVQASRTFHSGLATVRQLEFALFDLRLHRDHDPARGARVYETLDRVRDEVSVLRPPRWHRFPHSFSHIFAGGYAAGYYSYKWAEVLSADAFAAFEEEGLFNPAVSRRFRDTVLAQGGSKPAMEIFMEFRGRKPDIAPLLRQSGLVEA
ncbi:MAG TPA: M3 family metallopeptidase [Verrucomicrobiae bacterium]|nr:M3 family metallopeptidase [Verrucomicrobiae bacterium]